MKEEMACNGGGGATAAASVIAWRRRIGRSLVCLTLSVVM